MKKLGYGAAAFALILSGPAHAFEFIGLRLVPAETAHIASSLKKPFGLRLAALSKHSFLTLHQENYNNQHSGKSEFKLSLSGPSDWTPYISAGSYNRSLYQSSPFASYETAQEQGFSLGTGLRYQLDQDMWLDTSYHYSGASDLGLIGDGNNISDHQFRLGFTWAFE